MRRSDSAFITWFLVANAACTTTQALPPGPAYAPRAPVTPWRTASGSTLGAALDVLVLRLAEAPEAGALDVTASEFSSTDGRDCGFAPFLADALVDRLLRAGRFRSVVERRRLAALLKEQNLQTGTLLVDHARRVRVGKLIGANAIVAGSFSRTANGVTVSARLVAVETGQILTSAEASSSGDSKIAGMLCASGPLPGAPTFDDGARRDVRWLTGADALSATVCDHPQPWVGFVDIEGPFSQMPRHAYVDLGIDYGDGVWAEITLDGRHIPLCGRKQTIEVDGRRIDLAPAHSRVRVVVDDPEARLRLARQCWASNPVTDTYSRKGTGDFDTVSGGGGTGWAWACSYGQ
jgi:hypothetical protein